jgi:hypothetical protein
VRIDAVRLDVSEIAQQLFEFVATTVNVADQVEWASLVPPVGPKTLAHDGCAFDFIRTMQREDVSETLALQTRQRSAKLLDLLPYDVWSELPIRPRLISLMAKLRRRLENNRDGEVVIPLGERRQRASCFGLYVGSIDDRKKAGGQSFRRHRVQDFECIVGGSLVVLVVANQTAKEIRRQNLCRTKMPARKSGLASAGRADEYD